MIDREKVQGKIASILFSSALCDTWRELNPHVRQQILDWVYDAFVEEWHSEQIPTP